MSVQSESNVANAKNIQIKIGEQHIGISQSSFCEGVMQAMALH